MHSVGHVRPETAAALAPEIDRVALCIHRPTSKRSELLAALGLLDLPKPSIVAVAARFLAAGRVTVGDLLSMARYEPEAATRTNIDAHVQRGLLFTTEEPDTYVPSPAFREAASVVLTVQAEEAARLWASSPALGHVATAATAHVDAAARAPTDVGLDAFQRQVANGHTVPATPAGEVLRRVTELRYLRSDVHGACLADRGIAGPPARTLHQLWRGVVVTDATPATIGPLVDAGLAELADGRLVATDAGVRTRDRVEDETDERVAALFEALGDDASDALLDGLRTLAGDDPRRIEDR